MKLDYKDHGLSIPEINNHQAIVIIPWSFKMFHGLLIDRVSFFGSKRKSYLLLANVLSAVFSYVLIASLNVGAFTTLLFAMQSTAVLADVVYDALMIMETMREVGDEKGNFQLSTWVFRYIGRVLGGYLGASIWVLAGREAIYAIQGSVFLLQALVSLTLMEESSPFRASVMSTVPKHQERRSMREYLNSIRKTFKNSIFIRLIMFNVVTGLLPSGGPAFFFFLNDELKYHPSTMGLLDALGELSKIMGILLVKRYKKTLKIKKLYLYTQFASIIVSLLPIFITIQTPCGWDEEIDLGLNQTFPGANETEYEQYYFESVQNVSFLEEYANPNYTATLPLDTERACYLFERIGVSSYWFVFSDDVLGVALDTIKHVPLYLLTAILCEKDVEGIAYSLSLNVQNLVYLIQMPISSAVTQSFGITHGNFTNLSWMMLLCLLLEVIPILFLQKGVISNKTIDEVAMMSAEVVKTGTLDVFSDVDLDSDDEYQITAAVVDRDNSDGPNTIVSI